MSLHLRHLPSEFLDAPQALQSGELVRLRGLVAELREALELVCRQREEDGRLVASLRKRSDAWAERFLSSRPAAETPATPVAPAAPAVSVPAAAVPAPFVAPVPAVAGPDRQHLMAELAAQAERSQRRADGLAEENARLAQLVSVLQHKLATSETIAALRHATREMAGDAAPAREAASTTAAPAPVAAPPLDLTDALPVEDLAEIPWSMAGDDVLRERTLAAMRRSLWAAA